MLESESCCSFIVLDLSCVVALKHECSSMLCCCVGFVLVLSGKPMCIGCLSLGACLLVENYSMKTMESSCSHVRNITCQTSALRFKEKSRW